MVEPADNPDSGRQREISDESKNRILDAAEELFAEQGFDGTSLAEVADRSGISRGSIPWHFTNKSGLLMAVVQRATERSRSEPMPPGLGNLESVMTQVATRMRAPHMAVLHALIGEAGRPDSNIHASYEDFHEKDRRAIAEWLRGDPELTMPGADGDSVEVLIYAMFIGIHVQWRISPERVDLDAALKAMAELLRLTLREPPSGV